MPAPRPAAPEMSAIVVDAGTGEVLLAERPDAVRRVASVAKLLLLIEVAERATVEPGLLDELLSKEIVEPVADSGLWQYLAVDALSVADLSAMVGAVSDNLATNVLLDRIGIDAVNERGRQLGAGHLRLHDIVRDVRGPGDEPQLGSGTARACADLMAHLYRRRVGDIAAQRVLGWLELNVDQPMLGAAVPIDPLAHCAVPAASWRVWNKTGADRGVRADVGVVCSAAGRAVAYAGIVNWSPERHDDHRGEASAHPLQVAATMLGRFGEAVMRLVDGVEPAS